MPREYDFKNATYEETKQELSTYHKARTWGVKRRYADDKETLDRINRAHSEIKKERVEFLRTNVNIRASKPGKLWWGMISRCDPKYHEKWPSYANCSISDNFKDVNFFYNWCLGQKNFGMLDDKGRVFELDKDWLCRGTDKVIYSEDTCTFIPRELNSFPLTSKAIRGSLPIGVSFDNYHGRYVVQFGMRGSDKVHRSFKTVEEAFLCYKAAKEEKAKMLAEKWRHVLDVRVYDALMNFTVSITD